jgi:hypothetical protein
MALSRAFPKRTVSGDATATPRQAGKTTTEVTEVTSTPAAETAEDNVLKLDGLYNSASNLEVELEGVVRRGTALLTAGQVGAFNSVLNLARQLVPNSVALREDVDEIDTTVRPVDAHQALHVTIVPTLHNALPEPLYSRHG